MLARLLAFITGRNRFKLPEELHTCAGCKANGTGYKRPRISFLPDYKGAAPVVLIVGHRYCGSCRRFKIAADFADEAVLVLVKKAFDARGLPSHDPVSTRLEWVLN